MSIQDGINEYNKKRADFYTEAFKGVNVPEDIKAAAIRICDAYGIRGICDPVFISNVIAMNTGRGDGCSNFEEVKS